MSQQSLNPDLCCPIDQFSGVQLTFITIAGSDIIRIDWQCVSNPAHNGSLFPYTVSPPTGSAGNTQTNSTWQAPGPFPVVTFPNGRTIGGGGTGIGGPTPISAFDSGVGTDQASFFPEQLIPFDFGYGTDQAAVTMM